MPRKAFHEGQKHKFGIEDKEKESMSYIARCDCGCITMAMVEIIDAHPKSQGGTSKKEVMDRIQGRLI